MQSQTVLPLWRGTGQVAVVAVGCSLWISQIYKAATGDRRKCQHMTMIQGKSIADGTLNH